MLQLSYCHLSEIRYSPKKYIYSQMGVDFFSESLGTWYLSTTNMAPGVGIAFSLVGEG